ncbi:MAG TPA: hypothetical protein VI387_00910, partial [Candidatus Brocadiales bacterium]|nr:hypothetical protein [Candidatus Brocadiales bacterium]
MKTKLLPCYFHLKELVAGQLTIKALKDHIMDKFKDVPHPQLPELIDSLYKEGRFLFLLDGLDQTTSQDNLTKLLKNDGLLGNNHVIVAGRRWMYDRLDSEIGFSKDYQYIEISGFNNRLTKEYLGQGCYDMAKSMVSRELLKVPVLLRHIKLLFQSGELSQIKTRTELYDKIVNFLLKRDIDLGRLISSVTTPKTRFETLSYHTISKGYLGRFPTTEVFPELTQLLQISPDDDFPILTRLGIMYEIWEGEIEKEIVFRHQSFQEYFASFELKKRVISNGEVNKKALKEHLEYNRWDEVIFFLIGSLEAPIAKKIILSISTDAPFLAGKCIAHYKGDKDEDFKEIINGLFEKIKLSYTREALAKIGTD